MTFRLYLLLGLIVLATWLSDVFHLGVSQHWPKTIRFSHAKPAQWFAEAAGSTMKIAHDEHLLFEAVKLVLISIVYTDTHRKHIPFLDHYIPLWVIFIYPFVSHSINFISHSMFPLENPILWTLHLIPLYPRISQASRSIFSLYYRFFYLSQRN